MTSIFKIGISSFLWTVLLLVVCLVYLNCRYSLRLIVGFSETFSGYPSDLHCAVLPTGGRAIVYLDGEAVKSNHHQAKLSPDPGCYRPYASSLIPSNRPGNHSNLVSTLSPQVRPYSTAFVQFLSFFKQVFPVVIYKKKKNQLSHCNN